VLATRRCTNAERVDDGQFSSRRRGNVDAVWATFGQDSRSQDYRCLPRRACNARPRCVPGAVVERDQVGSGSGRKTRLKIGKRTADFTHPDGTDLQLAHSAQSASVLSLPWITKWTQIAKSFLKRNGRMRRLLLIWWTLSFWGATT
jgi:hypothetical protein